jgi:FaeA-like protein
VVRVHEQIPLFGGSPRRPARPSPLASSADPISSHLAAAELIASGRRDSQKIAILSSLRSQDRPCTSMELARAAGMDRYIVARRLPDLERDGQLERREMRACAITGRPAITWRFKERG